MRSTLLNNPDDHSFTLFPTTPHEITDIINNLKHKNTVDYDDINQNIIIRSAPYISEILCAIVNASFKTGTVPDELKIAKVIPIYKNGDKSLMTNYRPISILPILSKVFEKAMFNRLLNYLEKFNMLSPDQFGFRPNHSTYMPILKLSDIVTENFESGKYTIGIFFDLTKAFDVIDHKILLAKLNYYEIRGISHRWFSNYLSNRQQFTYVNSSKSTCLNINFGVPQGSILGPLLFIIFINDLPNVSSLFKYLLFADDTNVLASHTNLHELVTITNNELCKINEWFQINKLFLNIDKTNYIIFHSNRKTLPLNIHKIKIKDMELTQKTSTKFLGVTIDQNLNWKEHTSQIALKISKNMNIIRHILKLINKNALLKLYHSMIHPYLTYCNIVWCFNYKCITNRLQILQNKAIKLIRNFTGYIATNDLYKTLNILNLSNIHKYQTAIFMYKYVNNLLPIHFYKPEYFIIINRLHTYKIRIQNKFVIPYARTNMRLFSIKCFGPRIWNSLPVCLTNISNLPMFKINLKINILL
jgi:hypothetical protein